MNPSIQSWDSLPDHIKQQAAPEMLAGTAWSYFGKPVERPRDSELTRWIPPPVCPARRTNADKRRDVLATLKLMPRASLRAVARQTGTSHQFVANVRAGTRTKKRHPRSSMASSEASPTFNQAASVRAQDSLGGGYVNAPHSPEATRDIVKEESSTDDGEASLPVVSNCGQSWHEHGADECERAATCGSDGQRI